MLVSFKVGVGLRTVKSYSSWINCTDQMTCTSDPFSCSNSERSNGRLGLAQARPRDFIGGPLLRTVNLTKDNPPSDPSYVDPREGLAYQVETLLTNIGGRPCWKLEECETALARLVSSCW